ncbi:MULTISPECIES: (d)CMP kinase [unclassified Iodidimonas]|jgi:cytidylate kinase|uniref:(d)CMP kinase n=1 Tax=unclassified Iodidimonas TaxID=2626145 RepID=UPI00248267B5|nr:MULTISPECIES: (d)CMP kinase [unclassified Iodidimonas]
MIIAIDGPAASGKGTLGRRLAQFYGLAYLDTGSLYRAVGLALLRDNPASGDRIDERRAAVLARHLDVATLHDPALRDEATGAAASKVAAIPDVRTALLAFQRQFAQKGAVLDGRDIGTVVCPDADVKLYVTASDAVRAQRRFEELRQKGVETSLGAVLADLRERDARDQARATAPLTRAEDAVLLDTTELDIEDAFARACMEIESRQRMKMSQGTIKR